MRSLREYFRSFYCSACHPQKVLLVRETHGGAFAGLNATLYVIVVSEQGLGIIIVARIKQDREISSRCRLK